MATKTSLPTQTLDFGCHEPKKKAFRKNSHSLLQCVKNGNKSLAFALCAKGLITLEQRSGSATEIVDGLERRLEFEENVWERLIEVLKDQFEDGMTEKLHKSLEEELARFVSNGQPPTHSERPSGWTPLTRHCAAGPVDLLSITSNQRVPSGSTGAFIQGQSSKCNDSAIPLENGCYGFTQREFDSYTQEGGDAGYNKVSNPNLGTLALSSDESHKGLTLINQFEDVMSSKLQKSLEKELTCFVPNGQPPTHSRRQSNWISLMRHSATGPVDLLSNTSNQRVPSGSTGAFIQGQSSKCNDSAIPLENGCYGFTQQEFDSYTQEGGDAGYNKVSNPNLGTLALSSDESHKGLTLINQFEDVMSSKLQKSLEKELTCFVPNGQPPTHSRRQSNWISLTRHSATGPVDLLSNTSNQRVPSGSTGAFIQGQSSKCNDSAIPLENGCYGFTQQEFDSYTQEGGDAGYNKVSNPNLGTLALSPDESHKGLTSKNRFEDFMSNKLQEFFKEEFTSFVTNGQPPTHSKRQSDWIPLTRHSATGPVDLRLNTSNHQMASGSTGAFIQEQSSKCSDSVIPLMNGCCGFTQQQFNAYNQEGQIASVNIVSNPTLRTLALSSDESHKGLSTLSNQTAATPMLLSDTERQIRAQASENTEQHSAQATLATSYPILSENNWGLLTTCKSWELMSLLHEEMKKNGPLEHSLAIASWKVNRLTSENAELRGEIESLKRDMAEERVNFDNETSHSIVYYDEHHLLEKIEDLESYKEKLKSQMEENKELERQNMLSMKTIASLKNQNRELELSLALKQEENSSFERKVKRNLLKIEQVKHEQRRKSSRKKLLVELQQSRAFKNPFDRKKNVSLTVEKWRESGKSKVELKRQVKFNI